ncbi:hypothetical protein WA026_017232 [Henosepilachna vigintioctopunctata]|uniref:Uncharacterized protein n=1 Tax=Henosepilachna vigintioctopunctata TaxID=420089 RepID=A0AAW1UQE6_9CUCU
MQHIPLHYTADAVELDIKGRLLCSRRFLWISKEAQEVALHKAFCGHVHVHAPKYYGEKVNEKFRNIFTVCTNISNMHQDLWLTLSVLCVGYMMGVVVDVE